MYVFQLFDFYSASGSALLWVSLFQSIAIGWIYGKQSSHQHSLQSNFSLLLLVLLNNIIKSLYLYVHNILCKLNLKN